MAIKYQAHEWRPVFADAMMGICYNLDISEKLGPGEQWVLILVRTLKWFFAFKVHKNVFQALRETGNATGPINSQYFLIVREKEDDFAAGSHLGHEHLPKGIVMDGGKITNMVIKPEITEYRKDCLDKETLDSCVERHVDNVYPNCTRYHKNRK